MVLPVITPLPEAPSRDMQSKDFILAANLFMAALVALPTEINNLASELVTNNSSANFAGTSTTNMAIGTGAKGPFTTQTGKLWLPGQRVILVSASDLTAYMSGYVSAYNPNTGQFSIVATRANGAGSKADWNIGLSGLDGLSPGQWAQQAAITTTGAASITFTSIPNTFADLNILINGISSTGTAALRIELSSDGVTFSTALNLIASTTAATTYRGAIRILDYLADTGIIEASLNSLTAPAGGTNLATNGQPYAINGGIFAIRLSWASGTFDVTNAILRMR